MVVKLRQILFFGVLVVLSGLVSSRVVLAECANVRVLDSFRECQENCVNGYLLTNKEELHRTLKVQCSFFNYPKPASPTLAKSHPICRVSQNRLRWLAAWGRD